MLSLRFVETMGRERQKIKTETIWRKALFRKHAHIFPIWSNDQDRSSGWYLVFVLFDYLVLNW